MVGLELKGEVKTVVRKYLVSEVVGVFFFLWVFFFPVMGIKPMLEKHSTIPSSIEILLKDNNHAD